MTPLSRLCSVGLTLTILASIVYGVEPPLPEDPFGWDEWKASGKYPDEFPVGGRVSREVIFPTFKGHTASFQGQGYEHDIRVNVWCKDRFPIESLLHESTEFQSFECAYGDVIPLFGHLYLIGGVIKRVTDQVPQELRPAGISRFITLGGYQKKLFWTKGTQPGSFEFDRVYLLEIAEDPPTAKVELVPWAEKREWPTPKRSEDRKPLAGELRRGDLFATRGRAYRVLNVVPPTTLAVGRLVGWIELSADPVTPTEQDRVAELVEREETIGPSHRYYPPPSDGPPTPSSSRMLSNPILLSGVAFIAIVALLLGIRTVARRFRSSGDRIQIP